MLAKTKKGTVRLGATKKTQRGRGRSFFELALRHIVKSTGRKRSANHNLSREIDRIVYGV